MPLPVNWTLVTVTGQYLGIAGTPMSGKVKFVSGLRLKNVSAGLIVPISKVEVELDANGEFTVQLPATDDPDVSPLFHYQVYEDLVSDGDKRIDSYSIQLPAADTTVDISELIPVVSPVDMEAFATIGDITPGAWQVPVFEVNAGDPINQTPGIAQTAAGRIESAFTGVVRLRGGIGISGSFAQSVKFATLPLSLRPPFVRHVFVRTRGGTSTHTIMTIDTNGDMALQNTALVTGTVIYLDGVTYTL